jgi:hypothetical protein
MRKNASELVAKRACRHTSPFFMKSASFSESYTICRYRDMPERASTESKKGKKKEGKKQKKEDSICSV